ncbi:MAG: AraC family transcriptional regulator [Bacteroidales bacterium]|jgi:AraC-like DNA-binding protein|nr:AraC family transcriptional regulator [Bacteroidales bacterium]
MILKKIIYSTLLVLLAGFTYAKPPLKDSLSENFHIEQAEILYKNGDYKLACEQFMQANNIFNNAKQKQIHITLIFFFLLDIIGLFVFLYLEKQKAYKKLVSKNMQWAKKREFDEPYDQTEKKIIENMLNLFENEKIYRKKELTIIELAKKLNINKALVSKLTNTYFHKTLPALINEYRIKEAINLLTDNKTSNYKMEVISDMCGFNTRQVFHAAFKKETGLTPNDFRKMHLIKI